MSKVRRWLVLWTVSAGVLLIAVDMTVLYTALPTLTHDLQATASEKLWIINAYPLVMAGLLLGAGALGDRVGHKRMFLAGLVLFGLTSVLAAFAPSAAVLIAARAFLAVGAAAMMPATLALIRITFTDPREFGVAIGVWGGLSVCGVALGPIVGGLLLEYFWWGSAFLINVPVVAVAIVATILVAPDSKGDPAHPWDLIASLQVMVGLVGLVYAIKEVTKPDPSMSATVIALVVSLIGFWFFGRRQRKQPYPLIDFGLFRDRRILTGVIAASLSMFTVAGVQLVLTQRFQLVLELTPLHAGLIVAAEAVGALPASIVAGALLHRWGAKLVISAGMLISAIGVASLLLVVSADPIYATIGLVVTGAGLGAAMAAASSSILGNAPAHRAGMASSVEEVSYEFGSLTGVAILGSVLGLVYTSTVSLPDGADPSAANSIDDARIAAAGMSDGEASALLTAANSAFDTGYIVVVAVSAVALLGAAVLSAFLLRRSPTGNEMDKATAGSVHGH
ncbi:MFS transporter [Actinoalloteichus hymeniacidonis]|uniref:Arabinose efflux permease family protein n=1 Tax=Actinoalloteichus hymeniacidonis TaxID=340345 RepID=A0AAC9HSA4_9PSEU|nr:MFS transporter [Actinoalloteichus hymeniacidonis]AOS64056.1 arabinose efflux permease family protein [Actinoalloteichus hymeniacidonis]MBB5907882.1 DHA2 family multidrug resistance protein-like MFS transporter [Actinoalloteichus hymeniacidonis]